MPNAGSKRVTKLYPYQVAGHGRIQQLTPGKIIKPTNAKELAFYTYVNAVDLPGEHLWIKQVIPRFYGVSSQAGDEESYGKIGISLEDVNEGFTQPCILDCKMGQRQYDDDDSLEKQQRAIAKCNATTSAEFGIRFTGAQSYKTEKNGFESRDRERGRSMKGEDLIPEMDWFFSDGKQLRRETVQLVAEKMKIIAANMKYQTHFRLYSSSILIVYEGDVNLPDRVDVRMIDFAKTQWGLEEVDDGYILGINSLITLLNAILIQD